jgi:hypothetical protein
MDKSACSQEQGYLETGGDSGRVFLLQAIKNIQACDE